MVAVAVAITLLVASAGASPAPIDHYRGVNAQGAKLRLGVQADRTTGAVFQGKTRCTYRGEPVHPFFGKDVATAFDEARVGANGRFRSHKIIRHHNPLTHQVLPFTRTLDGRVSDEEGTAMVAIHFKTPLHAMDDQRLATCRTGRTWIGLRRIR